MKNGQKSSLYSETSPYSEGVPYCEPFFLLSLHKTEWMEGLEVSTYFWTHTNFADCAKNKKIK